MELGTGGTLTAWLSRHRSVEYLSCLSVKVYRIRPPADLPWACWSIFVRVSTQIRWTHINQWSIRAASNQGQHECDLFGALVGPGAGYGTTAIICQVFLESTAPWRRKKETTISSATLSTLLTIEQTQNQRRLERILLCLQRAMIPWSESGRRKLGETGRLLLTPGVVRYKTLRMRL